MRLPRTSVVPLEDTRYNASEYENQPQLQSYQWPLFYIGLVLNDFIMVGLGFRAAYFVRFELSIPVFKLNVVPSVSYYNSLVFFLIPFWLLLFVVMGLYSRQNLLGGTQEYSLIFTATTIGILAVVVVGFLGPAFIIARGWLVASWFLVFFFPCLGRFFLRRVVYSLRVKGLFLSPTIIVGANEESRVLAEQLHDGRLSGLHLLGFVDDHQPIGSHVYGGLTTLGSIDGLQALVKRWGVKELIVTSSAMTRENILDVFTRFGMTDGVTVRLSSGLYEIVTTGLQVKDLGGVPLVRVNKVRLTGMDEVLKNLIDYGITLPSILLLSPIYLLIALAVKLDSPGPIIHRRRVMGVNGKQFDAFKFRTMYVNGDEILAKYPDLQDELERTHKLKEDPRITRVGKVLRKFSLDELPQLFNVVRHEMSLVGPRMISPQEVNEYNQWGMNLLTIRPGITGLWQVSGRSDVTYDERVRLDMYYIRNWTVWLDIQLLLRTIPAVVFGKGAY